MLNPTAGQCVQQTLILSCGGSVWSPVLNDIPVDWYAAEARAETTTEKWFWAHALRCSKYHMPREPLSP